MDSSKKLLDPRDLPPRKPAPLPRSKMSTTKLGSMHMICGKSAREATKSEQPNDEKIMAFKKKILKVEEMLPLELPKSIFHHSPLNEHNTTKEEINTLTVLTKSGPNQDKPLIKENQFPIAPSRPLIPSKIADIPSTSTFSFSNTSNENNTFLDCAKSQDYISNVGVDDTFSITSNENNPFLDCAKSQDYITNVGVEDTFSITEFDPLHAKSPSSKFKGISNENILNSTIIDSNYTEDEHNSNKSKLICIKDNFTPIPEDDIIILDTQESVNLQTMTWEPEEEIECITIQDSQDTNSMECNSSCHLSDVTLSQVSILDKSSQSCTSFSEVIDVTSLPSQDSNVQIIEETRPSTSKPKSSTISKFKKLFGVQSEPDPKPVQKPAINSYGPDFNGILTWIADDNLVGTSKLWYCALFDQIIFCYSDSAMQILKESYKLKNVTSLQMVFPVECSNCLYCFELGISNSESSGMKHSTRIKITFGCPTATERLTWVQKIAVNLTSAFPSIFNSEFTRLGWCCLKVGVSGQWLGAWLMLAGRELLYYCTEDTADNVDLRKTRCISIQEADEESKKACPSDCCTNLLLDCCVTTLYLRFPHTAEFQNWNSIIKVAAHSNGLGLEEQQLTNEGVPTIVDKCINFIYAYGVLSEGIYRRAGSSVVLTELLTRFRINAWSVQLTPQIYSEHDVAGVFKRFFRDLPTPLISRECHDRLINALALQNDCSRLTEYRNALLNMSPLSCNTARKLFTHLSFIQKWREVNKMSAENLAAVWAPTIMPPCVDTSGQQITWSENEVTVVRDLIVNYQYVWCPDEDEIKRDEACHGLIMRMQESARLLPQPSYAGDLRIWVVMEDTCDHFQVTLTPNKSSADVCVELSVKTNIPHHKLMLEEQICNASMKRIVHKYEIVLDVVTRWGYWDDDDRKDNNLVIKENKILYQMDSLANNLNQVCGQLRYANDANKKFKSYTFEINSSKLSGYADSQGSSKVEEWNIKDIIWYFGHETKRDPQCRWAITFIPKNKARRSKEHPYFGNTLAGGVTDSQLQWATALMFAEHDSILTLPQYFLP